MHWQFMLMTDKFSSLYFQHCKKTQTWQTLPSQGAAGAGLFQTGDVTTALAVPSPTRAQSHMVQMGWAEQGVPAGSTDSPRQGKGYTSGHPGIQSRPAGYRGIKGMETRLWGRSIQETRHLQCRSKVHPRDRARDSPGDKATLMIQLRQGPGLSRNTAPESLSRRRVGKGWSLQPTIGALRALTRAEKVSALKKSQSKQRWNRVEYILHCEKQQGVLASIFPILCSLLQMEAMKEWRLQEYCRDLLTSHV